MPKLIIHAGSPAAWVVELKPGMSVIGRTEPADIVIPDASVSSRHCELHVTENSVFLKDLGSTNGSFVDDKRIFDGFLNPGQVLRVGTVNILLEPSAGPSLGRGSRSGPIRVPVPPRVPGSNLSRTATGVTTQNLDIPEPPPPSPSPSQTAQGASQPAIAAARPFSFCKSHPRVPSRYFCETCRQAYCELCVSSRMQAGRVLHICQRCGQDCAPVRTQASAAKPATASFFARLPQAFGYPLRGSGWAIIVGATIVLSVLGFIGPTGAGAPTLLWGGPIWSIVFLVMFWGYLFAFMQNIIDATATEEKELPPLPDMSDFWEDVLQPCLVFFALIAVCFSPVWVLQYFSYQPGVLIPSWVIKAARVLAVGYFPMAFLSVAILGTLLAANPFHVIGSILRAPLEYLVTVGLLYLAWALRALGDRVLPVLFPRGLGTPSMAKLLGFVSAEVLWSFVGLYLLTLSMHILGLLYACKKDKLRWLPG